MLLRSSAPLLLLAALAASLACDARAPAPPNVVLVVLDTTRADVLSCYGSPVPTTPHLDRLAQEGARFTRAFTTDFWTLPSHATLLTGLYPSRHGATAETNRLAASQRTLAEVLGGAGYRTGAFVSNPWVGTEHGFAQGFDTFVESWKTAGPDASDRLHDREAVRQAERFIQEGGQAEPFFAFLNLNRAHLPYSPDAMVYSELHPEPHPPDRVRWLRQVAGMWAHLAGRTDFDARDYEILRGLYDAEVATTDALVGQLLDALRAGGQLDRTLVIVTSDHGENIGEHGRIDHLLSMYETTLRVPLLIRYPRRVESGRVDEGLASLVDVFATVLDAAGLQGPETSGSSLLSSERRPRPFVVAENDRPLNGVRVMRARFPDFDADSIDERMRMIRTPRYKLVWREKHGVELYDLEQDPAEDDDLADRMSGVRDELLAELESWSREVGGRSLAGDGEQTPGAAAEEPFGSHDEVTRERLRALGYIE